MTNPLLIIRKDYAGLLQRYCKKRGLTARNLIGNDWRLADIVRSLRTFEVQTHFIIDIGACTEKDEELIKLLGAIKLQRDDAIIIIYAPDCKIGSKELDMLVRAGYTNIICPDETTDDNEKTEIITERLECCLFNDGIADYIWNKYVIVEPPPVVKEKPKKKKTVEIQTATTVETTHSFRNFFGAFSFVGSQSRIGTTSFALMCAVYFAQRNANVTFICKSPEDYRDLRKFYSKSDSDSDFVVMGAKFIPPTTSYEQTTDNILIYDAGTDISLATENKGEVWLIAGISYNEIYPSWIALDKLSKTAFSIAVPFSSKLECEKAQMSLFEDSETSKEIFSIPFVDNKIELPAHAVVSLSRLFAKYADETTD